MRKRQGKKCSGIFCVSVSMFFVCVGGGPKFGFRNSEGRLKVDHYLICLRGGNLLPIDLRGCLFKVVWCYNWEKLLRMSEETTQKAKEVLDVLQVCILICCKSQCCHNM